MAKRILKSVNEVVDALGGPSVLGDRFNIGQSAVSNWNHRGEIPPGWHLRIYLSVKQRGFGIDPEVFGLDSLDGLSPPSSKRKRQPAQQRAMAQR